MSTLSNVDVLKQLVAAGFPASSWANFIAIVNAESARNPTAVNPQNPMAQGLFQINLSAHPDVSSQCALDPSCSAKAALKIFQAGGYLPWQTYTNGAYKAFLADAQKTVAGWSLPNHGVIGDVFTAPVTGIHIPTPSIPNPLNALTGIPDALGQLGNNITSAIGTIFSRALWIFIGLVAAMVGLYLLIKDTEFAKLAPQGGGKPSAATVAEEGAV